MIRSLHLLALTLWLWPGLPARPAAAQTVYDLAFVSEVSGSTLQVTVRIRTGSGEADLGTSNFVFNYNDQALGFPSSPTAGVDYTFLNYTTAADPDYGAATVTKTTLAGQDRLSLNIELNNDNAGTVVPASYADPGGAQDVARLTFTILDPAQATLLTWEPGNTVAFDGDNQTLWQQGTLADDHATVLPVELTAFAATADGDGAVLTWTTASETNNTGFEVEHAPAGAPAASPWQTLAFVEGAGTATDARTYRYRADALEPGRHRFRLKQVDHDGTFTFSAEVEVTVELPGTYRLTGPYPNQFNPQAVFTLAVARPQSVRIEVFDLQGRRLAVLHDGPVEANETRRFTIDGTSLASGVYVIRAAGEHFAASRQALLVK